MALNEKTKTALERAVGRIDRRLKAHRGQRDDALKELEEADAAIKEANAERAALVKDLGYDPATAKKEETA